MSDEKTAEKAAERAGQIVIGPEATDDQVQHAADMADGKDDGIAARPETDLGNALYDYEAKRIGLLDLYVVAFTDAFSHGDRRPNAKDALRFVEVTGLTIADAAKKILALAALIPK